MSIVLPCGAQLLNVTFSFLSDRCIRWLGFVLIRVFLSLCHRRNVAILTMLYKVNSNWILKLNLSSHAGHCKFSEHPSASTTFRHTRGAATAHPLEFEVQRSRTSKFPRCFLPAKVRMWNDLLYNTVFVTCTHYGFKGAVNLSLLPWVIFSSVLHVAGACGVAKATYKQLCFFAVGPVLLALIIIITIIIIIIITIIIIIIIICKTCELRCNFMPSSTVSCGIQLLWQ